MKFSSVGSSLGDRIRGNRLLGNTATYGVKYLLCEDLAKMLLEESTEREWYNVAMHLDAKNVAM